MPYGMKRVDLQKIAQAKLDDATLLLQHGRHSNAYYLAGYAVEIGLKACIAAQVSAETIPDKSFINRILKHEFPVLLGLAGLARPLQERQDKDPLFAANWAIVSEWVPDTRYEVKDAMTAQLMLTAISDEQAGVLQWIKAYW
jgi:HEPN domain-containing protein